VALSSAPTPIASPFAQHCTYLPAEIRLVNATAVVVSSEAIETGTALAEDNVMGGPVCVVVADDDVLLGEGLASLLEGSGFDVVGRVGDERSCSN
jgi:hypothetical protein